MSATRIISLFKNRRLYDRTAHRYVTYRDLRRLIEAKVDFCVLSAQNDLDLTHSTILNLMRVQATERTTANTATPVLTVSFLRGLIRLGTTADPKLTRAFLDHTAATITSLDATPDQSLPS